MPFLLRYSFWDLNLQVLSLRLFLEFWQGDHWCFQWKQWISWDALLLLRCSRLLEVATTFHSRVFLPGRSLCHNEKLHLPWLWSFCPFWMGFSSFYQRYTLHMEDQRCLCLRQYSFRRQRLICSFLGVFCSWGGNTWDAWGRLVLRFLLLLLLLRWWRSL